MSVVIQADEHPPPHFHVRFADENASFSIADGCRLPNVGGLEKYNHNRWKQHYCKLIEVWRTDTRLANDNAIALLRDLAVRALYGEPNGSNVRRGHAARSIE